MSYKLEKMFQQFRSWLEMEGQAERDRMAERRKRRTKAEAERRGETLLDLVIADHGTGLGGRFLISFIKRNRTSELPWNRFRVGSPVIVSGSEGDQYNEVRSGVVSAKSAVSLTVALDEWPEGDVFRLDLSADEVTRARQVAALNAVQHARGRVSQLRDILIGEREFGYQEFKPWRLPLELNASQREAIQFAMAANDVAIIHGPPGTGKTTTIAEFIRQAVDSGKKVLATAPSNTGVDNLLEKLVRLNVDTVRIGHPARVQEELQSHTLDSLAEQDPLMSVVKEMMKEAEQLSRKAAKFTRSRPAQGAKQEWRQESRRLRDDARMLERQVVSNILDRAKVICATTTFDPDVLGDRWFDIAVIDEAYQSTEPGCWPVVLKAERIVLAGDHCQLPPTVLSDEAAKQGLSTSMMERLVSTHGPRMTRQLVDQYRMHQKIMEFSSKEFYHGTLVADHSVQSHLLKDMEGVREDLLTSTPLLFLDTAGSGWEEELEPDGLSRRNPQEAKMVLHLANRLMAAGLRPSEIAVIAPYAAQVRFLRENGSWRELEIDTVDGFQGREKEAVLISLVRSNAQGEIGFLADTRRMNVALTRARRKLIVVGDSATLGGNRFYSDLLQYFEANEAYHSIWEPEFQIEEDG